ncbi:hypothetical protein Tco_1017099 [Tanacetum coccineum]|uniref:Uncharacterized protein n=1 Tax=Tanacetum coccineum TaxID=301880 RepID=A0ABQ5FR19_9ASTR
MVRRGLHTNINKDDSEGSDEVSEQDDSVTGKMETDQMYINFGAMLKSISRDDLTELYRIVMNRYGMDGPEDELEKSEWLTGKETSNPFKIFNDSPLTGVNTPGSDENRLKLYDLMYIIVNVADMMDC